MNARFPRICQPGVAFLIGIAAINAVATSATCGGSRFVGDRCRHTASASPDLLPAWNDGAIAKTRSSTLSSAHVAARSRLRPVEHRVATFDNDGTLCVRTAGLFPAAFGLDASGRWRRRVRNARRRSHSRRAWTRTCLAHMRTFRWTKLPAGGGNRRVASGRQPWSSGAASAERQSSRAQTGPSDLIEVRAAVRRGGARHGAAWWGRGPSRRRRGRPPRRPPIAAGPQWSDLRGNVAVPQHHGSWPGAAAGRDPAITTGRGAARSPPVLRSASSTAATRCGLGAGAAPAPSGRCWYYTDPSRTQGFWRLLPIEGTSLTQDEAAVMSGYDIFAWIVLVILLASAIARGLHRRLAARAISPSRATIRGPQAVTVAGWITLFFGFALWPIAVDLGLCRRARTAQARRCP